MSARQVHGKATAARMAACAALGLHYWSGHPLPGHVWAVDDYQIAYAVRIYARDGLAQRRYKFLSGHEILVGGAAVPFVVSEETQDLFRVAA